MNTIAWAASLIWLMLPACTPVDGGAVELSWWVRTEDGVTPGCDAKFGLDDAVVRLECTRLDAAGSCQDLGPPEWPCAAVHGSTDFSIPVGTWEFSIAVEGSSCTEEEIRVPDPIVREIEIGQVAQLNALLILVEDDCEF